MADALPPRPDDGTEIPILAAPRNTRLGTWLR
jgi:hypothetical protein